jgi:hypothetical protein
LALVVDYIDLVVGEDKMVLDLLMMFVVDLYEMILNFEIIMMAVDLVVVVVVDLMMLKDNLLDEIMVEVVETLKDDHHDLLNHHVQTFEDEEDENLHFVHITKNKK